MKFMTLIFKNLRRNLLRSMLTGAGVMVLVFVITLIWSILGFLDVATSEKTSNFKGIVTEKWSIPSQMPFSYAATLENGAAREQTDVKPIDSMTWQFFIGSTEKGKMGFNSFLFAFCMEPKKLLTMMDELDSLQPGPRAELEKAILLGVVAGSVSSIGTYLFVNKVLGGIPFQIAFFSSFPVLDGALWWGAAIGFATSFAGSILPALSTRSIKVVDVFSKIA